MDETTPLLHASSSGNRHPPIARLAVYNQQTPQVENGTTSTKQASLLENGATSNLDARREDLSSPENCEQETGDKDLLAEIVKALCSAWQESRKPKSKITLDFFTTWELLSMHRAWRSVTRGKSFNLEEQIIAESLAEAMAIAITPKSPFPPQHLSFMSWNLEFHADKNLLATNLLREWKRITEGDDLDNFTLSNDSEYQQLVESDRAVGFGEKLVQLSHAALSLILNFRFQILLHSLLFIWPLSILLVAINYWDCSIGCLLYLLIILGSIGCLTISIRLTLILLTRLPQDPESWFWGWVVLRWTEFGFLIVFIIQAYRFFSTNPPSEPGLHQCLKNFYSANLMTNYVSITLLSTYLLVYFKKICLTTTRDSS